MDIIIIGSRIPNLTRDFISYRILDMYAHPRATITIVNGNHVHPNDRLLDTCSSITHARSSTIIVFIEFV